MTTLPDYVAAIKTVPQLTGINLWITKLSVYIQGNGWLVLPILSCLTQLLMTKITQNKNAQAAANRNNKAMTWMMPLFSLFICFGYNASFALYWVMSNCYSIVQTIVLNRILNQTDKGMPAKVAA